ncbi:CAC [Symbiodinium sp. CCMP2456]|nr:CAC [Symbiodinium sp. CCMP2456]
MEEATPKVIAHVDEVLQSHQVELLERLELWLQALDARLLENRNTQVHWQRAGGMPEDASLSSKELGRVTSVASEGSFLGKRRRSPLPRVQHTPSLNSYDKARLAHSRVVEEAEKKNMQLRESRSASLHVCQHYAQAIVDSKFCTFLFGFAVLTNSLLLGIHLEWQAVTRDFSSGIEFFTTLHTMYSLLFTLEVCLRLTADGCRKYVWKSSDWAWNWLDIFVVMSSWVELASELLNNRHSSTSTNSNLRILRLLRVGKLVRVVRVFRVVKFFRSLRTLVQSLMATMKSLFWAMILLALIIYIFSILFTDAVIDYVRETGVVEMNDTVLEQSFGTLYESYLTLFRSISNGVTWGEPANALSKIPEGNIWVQLFHFYIAFCSFAVLNVMTGVFCNSAIKAAERDHEMLVMSLVQSRIELKGQVANLFQRIDERGLGQVTIEDFEKHFDDDAVIAFFESLEVGAMDAWTLFMSLDVDGDHTISVEEFTERCLKLHGPARSADLYALRHLSDKHSKQLDHIEDFQKRCNKRLDQLSRAMSVHAKGVDDDEDTEVLKNWL